MYKFETVVVILMSFAFYTLLQRTFVGHLELHNVGKEFSAIVEHVFRMEVQFLGLYQSRFVWPEKHLRTFYRRRSASNCSLLLFVVPVCSACAVHLATLDFF